MIVAGGTGTRMGGDVPKQFLELGGMPILLHTVKRFLDFDPGQLVALVLHPDTFGLWEQSAARWLTDEEVARVQLCEGGAFRSISVWNGLNSLKEGGINPSRSLVAIQDGVRPFATGEMLAENYRLAAEHGAAVTAVPVKSSMRRVTEEGSEAVDRRQYYHVQTPQTFRFDLIYKAYAERPHDAFTDDASLFEAMDGQVQLSPGSYDNIKVTTPEDMLIGEGILARFEG